MLRAAVIVAFGCGSAQRAPAPSPLAGDARCHQAIDHMDELAINGKVTDPEQRTARLQAVQQARAAGVLGGDRTPDCVKRWTNTIVDCVVAATDTAAADACIPAS